MSNAYLSSRIVQHVQQGSKKKEGFAFVDIFVMSHTQTCFLLHRTKLSYLPSA
jgi:hypothetical protein